MWWQKKKREKLRKEKFNFLLDFESAFHHGSKGLATGARGPCHTGRNSHIVNSRFIYFVRVFTEQIHER